MNSLVIVVNNQQSSRYKNKDLSGVGVVYQLCRVFDDMLTFAVRRKYSLLSSFFLAHSSLITALWLATSLARNLLSPSVIILILIWLIAGSTIIVLPSSGYWSCDHFHRRST